MRVFICGVSSWRVIASCGGTIARYVDAGHDLTLAPLLDSRSPESTALGAKAAGILGATYDPRPAAPSGLADTRAARDSLMDGIRHAAPEVIIGPSPESPLRDDAEAARLVFNAAYGACVPNYPSPDGIDASPVRAAILYMDFGALARPDDYVDISEQWQRKVAALEPFSALGDVLEARMAAGKAEIIGRARGVQVQREFVEAFAAERVWGRLRPVRLLP